MEISPQSMAIFHGETEVLGTWDGMATQTNPNGLCSFIFSFSDLEQALDFTDFRYVYLYLYPSIYICMYI